MVSAMRIIAGDYRGRKLQAPKGHQTRPILDRAREALFNILAADVPDCLFLDLYAGSGSVGLEAISRGALRSTFVESAHSAVTALQGNVDHLGVRGRARVIVGDVPVTVDKLVRDREVFDIIYLGPPYDLHVPERVFEALALMGDPLVIIQHHPKILNFEMPRGWKCIRKQVYGLNALTFLLLEDSVVEEDYDEAEEPESDLAMETE